MSDPPARTAKPDPKKSTAQVGPPPTVQPLVDIYIGSLQRLIALADVWERAVSLPSFPTLDVWQEIVHELSQIMTLWKMLDWDRRSPDTQPDIPTSHITGIKWAHVILSPIWKRVVSAVRRSALEHVDGRIIVPPTVTPRNLFPHADLEALRAAWTVADSVRLAEPTPAATPELVRGRKADLLRHLGWTKYPGKLKELEEAQAIRLDLIPNSGKRSKYFMRVFKPEVAYKTEKKGRKRENNG